MVNTNQIAVKRQNYPLSDNTILSEQLDKMNSLQISEITGKRHADVMRDIRNLVQQLENDNERNFALVGYQDIKGEQRPMYILTKKGCLCLASGYDANLRMKIINRWEELERQKQYGSFQVPQTFADALLLAAKQQKQLEALAEQNQLQSQQLKESAPKVEYFENVLQSVNTYTSTQIAKEIGLKSADQLHKKLREMKVMYYQSGQWLLTAKYCGKGYTKARTTQFTRSDGSVGTNTITVWSEAGRMFIHQLLEGGNQ